MFFVNYLPEFLYQPLKLSNVRLTDFANSKHAHALIQSQFNYACSAWYPNLTKKLKLRIQTTQNKCMRFCSKLHKLKHISYEDFERLNWLPVIIQSFLSISINNALII